jgi:protein-tyrosine-phosphatase
MPVATRQRHRIIWAFGLGYFAFYVPYSALIKLVVTGSFGAPVTGFELLPAAIAGTLVAVPLLLTMLGWWKHATRQIDRRVVLSGVATAIIIATTTLAYGFPGASILFTLLLLRGGVLVLAPIVDLTGGRHVRWFSWVAFALSVAAIATAFSNLDHTLTAVAMLNIAFYLFGYILRLPAMTAVAKREDVYATRRYFVNELLVACAVLAIIGAAFSALGFVNIWTSSSLLPALTIGALYAALYVFGTLIYLDRRENTFCVPLNRASSLLAGVAASMILTDVWGFPPMPSSQLAGVTLVFIALLFLSPLHHTGEVFVEMLQMTRRGRLLLFVCSGNTCRSPMAEAIANAQLRRPFRAISAGVSAKVGETMTREACDALGHLTIKPHKHASRTLTPELIAQAEVIYCMTSKHRDAVIGSMPAAAAKTFTLDPAGDIDDPIGKPLESYVACARTIQQHVRTRFDELGRR